MGLTIHYELKLPAWPAGHIKKQVELLRQKCLDLPFEKVFETKEFKGKACDYEQYPRESDLRWFLVMASHGQKVPTHVIGFDALVGQGCESLDLAFTKEVGKSWTASGFCKTQYASNPDCGGVANFLKCHMLVIKVMDIAKELGFTVEVSDEGNYWEARDVKKLAEEVGEWNTMIAGLAGALTDAFGKKGDRVESEITKYPNYEHLEAVGAGEGASPLVKELKKIS
jgi:hypothetical protein